jgi:hypothetical protein
MNKTKYLSDEDNEYLAEHFSEVTERWIDLVKWEETPFRSGDDVCLLSFGFKYSSSGESMYKVDIDGTTWAVDISKTVPVWHRNGKRIGSMTYDEVVNIFSKRNNSKKG